MFRESVNYVIAPLPPASQETAAAAPLPKMQPLSWHILTCEYPPQMGGVSDYTYSVAAGLATQGDEVHVWCPQCSEPYPQAEGVAVHREFGTFSPADLRRVGMQLDRFPGPRRILVQWVPHGYGYHSMNLGFCWWLRNRAKRNQDRVEIMLHEPYLPFRANSLRQNVAAAVHRLMSIVLLSAARRVWVSIPAWERRMQPYRMGRATPFEWLPVPANVPVTNRTERSLSVRRRYAGDGGFLIGHFGTHGPNVTEMLEGILADLARDPSPPIVLLIGAGSERFRERLIREQPSLAATIQAAGKLAPDDLSDHIAACDLLIQPYPDGLSTRRSSLMAGLAHAKPIVTTIGPLSEPFWTETGALAIAKDREGFVALVRELRGDASERARIGEAAGVLYRDRFDIRHIIRTLRAAAWKPADEGMATR